jgi:glycosyltransferase involved in cell wall biosynthesis
VLFGSLAASLINFRGPLIREMVRRGYEVHAVAPDIDEATRAQLVDMGAVPQEVKLGRTSLSPLEAIRTVQELTRLFRDIGPEVVIAYTIKPIGLAGAASKAARVPRFVPLVTGLGYAFTGGAEPRRVFSRLAGSILYRRAFRQASVALFQNPDDLAEFRRRRLLPARLPAFLINGSGVDLEEFREAALPADVSFLMIARLLKDKGVREYGEAACALKKRYPDLRISLAGFIDSSPDSISQAELNQMIAGGVEFLGWLPDVRGAIADHSVYVLPSYREGTPRSVLEAAAIGRAIVTTDAPGCRETVVHGKNGLLVGPRDADSLLGALEAILADPAQVPRMAAASRRMAEEKFDVNKVNADLLAAAGL